MTMSPEGLQAALSLAFRYSVKKRFMFNPSKCKVMIFGEEMLCHKSVLFKFGKDILDRIESEILLGTMLTSSKKEVLKCIRK